jgi:hypothetical protein
VKGTNLARVALAGRAGFALPLEGVRCETLFLDAPSMLELRVQTVFLTLEGEAVIDLPDHFVHLRRGEAVTVVAGTVRLNPVNQVVLLRISDGRHGS